MTYASGVTYWEQFLPGLTIVFLAIAVLPWLSRDNSWIRTGVIALCLFVSWRYLLWRIGFTLPPLGLTLDYAAGLVFLVVETLAMIGGTLSLLFLTRTINRTPEVERNLPWVRSLPRPPLVDVLICTYNEDESILERTVIGALALDYPNAYGFATTAGAPGWKSCASSMAAATSRGRTMLTPRPETSITRSRISHPCRRGRTLSRSSMPTSCRSRPS
jgi:cellulose synthase (UDP-forming)